MTEAEVKLMMVGDEIQLWIIQNEFVSMDEENENEIYVVDAKSLANKIKQLTGADTG